MLRGLIAIIEPVVAKQEVIHLEVTSPLAEK
jgi:hypothetical protein